MKNKEIIQKLKKLEKIEPSEEWLGLSRDNLISQISWENRSNAFKVPHSGFLNWFKSFQSFALAVCLLIIFLGGPWLMVGASQVSLPGDLLYSVKRASEGIQSRVASKERQSQLQIEFADRRLEEFSKITEDSFSPEEKNEKTKKVIGDFRDNLAEVSANLEGISKEKALAVAKKTIKIKEDLTKAKEEASFDVQDDLVEAEKAIEKINSQILAVLIKDAANMTEDAATTTPDEEILIFLGKTDTGTITTTDMIINGVNETEVEIEIEAENE